MLQHGNARSSPRMGTLQPDALHHVVNAATDFTERQHNEAMHLQLVLSYLDIPSGSILVYCQLSKLMLTQLQSSGTCCYDPDRSLQPLHKPDQEAATRTV